MYLMRVDHFGLVIRILYTATSVSSIAASFLLFCTCITTLLPLTTVTAAVTYTAIITVIRHAVAAATVIVLS